MHSRLDDGAALAVGPDRPLDRIDDLRASEPEASDVRTGQESQPQAAGQITRRPEACSLIRG